MLSACHHQVRIANHHRRIVPIPFTLSVLIGVTASEDLLLMLRVLKLRVRKDVLEIMVIGN